MKTAPKNNEVEKKTRFSLLPWDIIANLVTPAYEEGTLKYVRESWREGFQMSVMYDAAQRHINAFYFDKEKYDQETLEKYKIKKHHIGAAIFCLLAMYWTSITRPELDDRPKKTVPTQERLMDKFRKSMLLRKRKKKPTQRKKR
jgi:hypothetical protein